MRTFLLFVAAVGRRRRQKLSQLVVSSLIFLLSLCVSVSAFEDTCACNADLTKFDRGKHLRLFADKRDVGQQRSYRHGAGCSTRKHKPRL